MLEKFVTLQTSMNVKLRQKIAEVSKWQLISL